MNLSKKLFVSVIVCFLTQLPIFSMNFEDRNINDIKFVILHDNNVTAENAWYRWMEKKINQLGFPVILRTMPGTIQEKSSLWLPYMEQELHCNKNTIIIAHAAGAHAALRYAEKNELLGLFLIAPSKIMYSYNEKTSYNYSEEPLDTSTIRDNVLWTVQFSSIDDPFVPYETEALSIKEMLQSKLYMCKNMHHIGDVFHTNIAIFTEIVSHLIDNKLLKETSTLWLTINRDMPDYDRLCDTAVVKLAKQKNVSADALRYKLRYETSVTGFDDTEYMRYSPNELF